MRFSPKETAAAGIILAATAIVLVPNTQVSAEDNRRCIAYVNGKFECADTELEPHDNWGEYQICAYDPAKLSDECMKVITGRD
jgi:hypothetical protein